MEFPAKFVRDWLALKLLLRRQRPDVLMAELHDQEDQTQLKQLLQDPANNLTDLRLVILSNQSDGQLELDPELPANLVWQSSTDVQPSA